MQLHYLGADYQCRQSGNQRQIKYATPLYLGVLLKPMHALPRTKNKLQQTQRQKQGNLINVIPFIAQPH